MLPTRLRCAILFLATILSACAGTQYDLLHATNGGATPPTAYKADIAAFLRTYLNDPTNIRDAAASRPMLLRVGTEPRYVVCVRFNAKNSAGKYSGVVDIAFTFDRGALSRYFGLDAEDSGDAAIRAQLREPCKTAAYQPFPELQQLTR